MMTIMFLVIPVSIPNGKGKAMGSMSGNLSICKMYQFPMGKVKVGIVGQSVEGLGINSQWER